jgi:hypothetical protein
LTVPGRAVGSRIESVHWPPFVFGIVSAALILPSVDSLISAAPQFSGMGATDFDLYVNAARRWLADGSFYQPYQLQDPYNIAYGDILYPPVVLWLMLPFVVLPAFLWWALPLMVTAWGVARLRPDFVAWPLLALCISWPPTLVKVVTGNPVLWVVAAVTVGMVITGPAVLALIKPSLLPFALWGSPNRTWWLWLSAFAALCVPFGSMWLDWVEVVANSRGGGLLYSAQEIPMLLLPLIAWLARTRPGPGPINRALGRNSA